MLRRLLSLRPATTVARHTTVPSCSAPAAAAAASRCFASASASPKQVEDLSTLRARLLYQSKKRGILENDILLGEFAEEQLQSMDKRALQEYDTMINGEHMEWDLYYYLSGKKPAPAEVANTSVFPMLMKFVEAKRKAGAKPE